MAKTIRDLAAEHAEREADEATRQTIPNRRMLRAQRKQVKRAYSNLMQRKNDFETLHNGAAEGDVAKFLGRSW